MAYIGNTPGTAPTPGNLPSAIITAPTYNILISDANILLLGDASGGVLTANLPALSSVPLGYTTLLKKIDSSGNAVTVVRNGSDTINGLTSLSLVNQYDGISLTAGNTAWYSYASSNNGVSASYVQTSVQNLFTKQQNFGTATLTDATNITWPLQTAQVAKVTLTASRTLANPTNMVDGGTYLLKVIQGGSGSYSLSYDTAYDFGTAGTPTLSTTVGLADWFTFVSNGTKMDFIGIAKGYAA